RRQTTAEGLEVTFATNVLGYHWLTRELTDLLRASAPARVVNVASTLAGGLDLDDVQLERRAYSGELAYSQSKQADRLLTWALSERLAGSGVTANAVHPGFVRSELNRAMSPLRRVAVAVLMRVVAKSPEQGADTPTWAASSAEVSGLSGKLFARR